MSVLDESTATMQDCLSRFLDAFVVVIYLDEKSCSESGREMLGDDALLSH